jgi:hypothetical protein
MASLPISRRRKPHLGDAAANGAITNVRSGRGEPKRAIRSGRPRRFNRRPRNGRHRRYLPVRTRPDEGQLATLPGGSAPLPRESASGQLQPMPATIAIGRNAPIPAVRVTSMEPPRPTRSRPSHQLRGFRVLPISAIGWQAPPDGSGGWCADLRFGVWSAARKVHMGRRRFIGLTPG